MQKIESRLNFQDSKSYGEVLVELSNKMLDEISDLEPDNAYWYAEFIRYSVEFLTKHPFL